MKRPTPEGHNRGPIIEDRWLFLGVDGEGREGVLTCLDVERNFTVPMMATDEARVNSLRATAQERATRMGQTVKLVRFHMRHDVEVFIP